MLVRHATPLVDRRVHRSRWRLGPEGSAAARQLGEVLSRSIGGWPVLCSTEQKAIETAAQLAPEGTQPVLRTELGEVEHPWYERHEDHQRRAREYLAGGDVDGWEAAADAASRFSEGLASAASARVVAVTHGTVMTLWARTVVDGLDAGAFWQGLSMPDAWRVDIERSSIERLG